MKKMRKVVAMLLALAMVLGMSLTAFAAPEDADAGSTDAGSTIPSAEVKVLNVEAGSTVTAYQIVTYQTKGQYDLVIANSIEDLSKPTADEILALAGQTANLPTQATLTGNGTEYKGTLAAGMWLILVSDSNEEIYNPMIVSVEVDPTGTKGGTVDADGRFKEGTVELYAKSSKPTLEKEVENLDYELNDEIKFTVTSKIPAYAENYTEVIYTLTDELSDNLEYVKDDGKVTVTIGGEPYPVSDANLEYGIDGKNNMKITIDSDMALAKGGQEVKVVYYAKLTDEAKAALDDEVNLSTNKVTLEYSNNPLDSSKTVKLKDKTNQYTFSIDALVQGKKAPNFVKTDDGEKKDENGESIYTPLPGAVFELVELVVDEDGNETYANIEGIDNVTTGEDGLTTFKGLDADKTYYIHELKAPEGYVVIDDIYVPVVIKAEYKDVPVEEEIDGVTYKYTMKVLESYEIKVGGETTELNGEKKSKYTWTNPADDSLNGTSEGNTDEYDFINTKLSSLPSTGGIGTTIFTIGGCLIMIIAAGLFFASRKKSAR